jgi:hypothetical protein
MAFYRCRHAAEKYEFVVIAYSVEVALFIA